MSGQKASLQKSSISFSSAVTPKEARIILNMVGIPSSLNLGKYLGTPSIHGRVTKVLYQPLIDIIATRLSGWKTSFLSFAGRVTLAKSVLTSIPIYIMQSTLLPVGVCNNIDKLVWSFIWGHMGTSRGIHLLNWDMITLDKAQGGLRIRCMRKLNLVMLAKLGWRFYFDQDSLWVRVLDGKYAKGSPPPKSS